MVLNYSTKVLSILSLDISDMKLYLEVIKNGVTLFRSTIWTAILRYSLQIPLVISCH